MSIEHYAVIGDPVAHSLSPQIHQAFAEATGQPMDYRPIRVAADGFNDFWRIGSGTRLAGANITLPHKQRAWALADRRSACADKAGAVNTLSRDDQGLLTGDNTDGVGLVADLIEGLGWPLRGRRLLILGAGGAARGILGSLLDCQPAAVVVANRDGDRAGALSQDFSGIETRALDALDGAYDLVINATSAGHQGLAPAIAAAVLHGARCYDLSYGPAATPFLQQAGRSGAIQAADGLGMLIEQAAASFELWRGVRPGKEVRVRLRDALRAETPARPA